MFICFSGQSLKAIAYFYRMSFLLTKPDFECEYFVYGNGKNILFAFHGFGNHATDFQPLAGFLGNDFTIVSVNLFFHGKSSVLRHLIDHGFSTDRLKELMLELMERFGADKCRLMGFSLGGRIAMKIAELFPERVTHLYLLAPDGLTVSPFYRFSTLNPAGRYLFRKSIDKSDTLIRLAGLLKKYRFIDDKKYQLAMYHLESRDYRQRVYDVWMVFRKIKPDLVKLRRLIASHPLQVHQFFGKYDRIILSAWGEYLRKGLENKVKTTVIESGHQLVRYGHLESIAQHLLKDKNLQ